MHEEQKFPILKALGKLGTLFYSTVTGLTLATYHVVAFINTPNDYDDFKIAENIDEYFNYLSQDSISRSSEVDRVIPLQNALLMMNYDLGQCGADGIYGDKTESAVRLYQANNDLRITGVADTKTLKHLAKFIDSNEDLESRLDGLLLEPYQSDAHQEFMAELPEMMRATAWSTFFRPDVGVISMYEGTVNNARADAASLAFSGCENNHLRDGFRHAHVMFNLAKYSVFGGGGSWQLKWVMCVNARNFTRYLYFSWITSITVSPLRYILNLKNWAYQWMILLGCLNKR